MSRRRRSASRCRSFNFQLPRNMIRAAHRGPDHVDALAQRSASRISSRLRDDAGGGEALAGVAFEEISKIYPDGTRAVAGLEDISEGVLKIGERIVNHVPSRDRDIAMVFQSYALYPHLSVYENIAFGLKLKKLPKSEIDGRVQNAARLLGLEDFLKRKPRALSGGQRQRVAMGRAIVREPQAFLMDEPLSNLDAK